MLSELTLGSKYLLSDLMNSGTQGKLEIYFDPQFLGITVPHRVVVKLWELLSSISLVLVPSQ